MIGILIALLVSWILLYIFCRKNILSLGFLPISKRLKQFATGFFVTTIICVGVEFLEMQLKSSSLSLNHNISATSISRMFWWDFKSVLTEELIFRGALLIIVINRFGLEKGILTSAIAFGIYHWFSFEIFGDIVPMFFVFIGTGLMGYAWALAYAKTKSIIMPAGLHLGWNFTFNTIFSRGPLGEGLIISKGGHVISDWFSLIGLWIVPIIVFLIIKYLVPSDNNQGTEMRIKNAAGIM